MAWNDEPTEMQLGTIYSWLKWHMPWEKASAAVSWLEKSATRRDVSYEMTRLRALKEKRLLDGKNCFQSDIWEGFDHE